MIVAKVSVRSIPLPDTVTLSKAVGETGKDVLSSAGTRLLLSTKRSPFGWDAAFQYTVPAPPFPPPLNPAPPKAFVEPEKELDV